jgi:hypothetical protein
VQAAAIAAWNAMGAAGSAVFQSTIIPRNQSTTGWTDLANQSSSNPTHEAVRVNFNDWLRAGAPILAGVATTSGTPGAVYTGNAGHPLTGIFEAADTVESSRNSGKWAVPAGVRSVTDAAAVAGNTVVNSATAAFTAADVGKNITINGAGTAGATYYGIIATRNSATQVTITPAPATTVPVATAFIGGLTAEGIHPAPAGHILMVPSINLAAFVAR